MINHTPSPRDMILAATIDIDLDIAIRNFLISTDPDDLLPLNPADRDRIRTLINDLDRESLTAMLLDYSLCPLHAIDYAICFDDDDPDCAAIRIIHPTHDT